MTNTIVKILFFVGNLFLIGLTLLQFRLTVNEWLATSVLIAYFYTRIIINEIDLENKISEIKDLLNKLNNEKET